jgi:predicted RNA binding protein YcfA (HicA-like mRNA interferase family)
VKYRDLIRQLEDDGWQLVRTKGSHRVYKHPAKEHNVIIAGHSRNEDVPIGILKAIQKQIGGPTK